MFPSATGQFCYSAHSVTLCSNRQLDFLEPSQGCAAPDLRIWLGLMDELRMRRPELDWDAVEHGKFLLAQSALWRQTVAQEEVILYQTGDQQHLVLVIFGAAGGSIEVGWCTATGAAEDGLEHAVISYFLPSLLGMALRLAGRIVLHGNAICGNGRALAWLGEKGVGKTTLAAAFVDAGYSLLADDQIVVQPRGKSFFIPPGVCRLRIWPEALAGMVQANVSHQLQQPFGPSIKGYLDLGGDASPSGLAPPVPLSAIYVLQPRRAQQSHPLIETPSRGMQLHLLLKQCIARTSMPLSKTQQRAEFLAVGSLAQHIPVRLLHLPDDLGRLPEVVHTLMSEAPHV